MKTKKQIPEVDYSVLVWKLTDPDNHQYGREVSPGVFQFKEFDRNNYISRNTGDDYEEEKRFIDRVFDDNEFWIEDTIVLTNFTDKEIRGHVSAYYNSLEALKEIYGKDSDFIIAECIFEQSSGLY